jgi:hypothetical protein
MGHCGSPRITAELRREGRRVSVNTVAQIMAELGVQAQPGTPPPAPTPPVDPGGGG